NLLGTGNTFNTPSISSPTTYYASAGQAGSTGMVTIGEGESTTIAAAANPMSANYRAQSTQYIIRASELIAAGVAPGSITSLGIDVSTAGSAVNEFYIRLNNTNTENLGTGFADQGSI